MSEYAVNKQTGEVLKRDQSGSWQKVKSAKNATGEILINEGSGWGAVPSSQAAPVSPFLQRGMDMVANAQATPRTGKEGALDRKNESIRLAQQAQKALQAQADEERKARVQPVQQAADVAAQQAAEEYKQTATWPDRTDRLMQQDFARQQVFNQAGVVSPADAFTARAANSLTFGAPGFVSEDFRETIQRAGEDQPGASLAGDIAGYLVPGEALWQGGKAIANTVGRPIVSRIMPQGGSALARGTRFTGRYGTQTGAWAGSNAAYQGTVGESVRAAEEGRAPTLANAAGGAITGATDWLNLAGPAAVMGLNRVAKYIGSGGVTSTPDSVVQSMTAAGQPANDARQAVIGALNMEALGSDIRPQAIDRVIRELESGGLSRENIGGLFQSINQRFASLPEGQTGRLTVGQAMIEALERDFPQAAENILGTLRERRLSARKGDRSAGIARQVSGELRETQGDFLGQSVNRNLGEQGLINIDDQVAEAKRAIGQEYERVLAAADPSRPEARGIALIVQNDPSASGVLLRRAQNAGFESVEAYVAAQPDTAGHWLRSALAQAARGSTGREKLQLETTVKQLDELLETNAGYKAAREAYGTEMGVDDATDFGANFVSAARNEYSLDLLMRQLKGMSEREKEVAMASVRNNLNSYMRSGPEDASARISSLTSAGVLDALERLGEQGKSLADDLRFIRREQRFLGSFDPEANSRTAINAQAIAGAQARGNSPAANAAQAVAQPGSLTQDVVISGIAGTPLPIMTAKRGVGGIIGNAFGPRIKTLEDQTRFYMSRQGNVPRPPESADFTPSFERGAPTRTVGAAPAAAPNAFASGQPAGPGTAQQGFGNAFAESALGSVGGSALGSRTDLNGDGVIDEQDMLIGAAGGGLGVPAVTGAMRRGGTVGVPRGRSMGMGGGRGSIDEATGLPINEDGTVTIYHATKTKEAADEIRRTGMLKSAGEPNVYVSSAQSGTGYGDYVVPIKIDPKRLILDDEFPDGRKDFRINVGRSRQASVKTMGLGGNTPKTPQQAARAELPGSPEYEAAKAKGLDMSQAGRMARAKEMGFDTEKVLYHGTPDRRPIDAEGFKTARERNQQFLTPEARDGERGPYWFTENRKKAQSYADDSRAFDSQNADPAVLQVFLRKPSNPLIIDAGGTVFSDIPRDRVLAALSPEALAKIPQNWRRPGGDSFRSDDIVKIARDAGFDGIQIRNVIDDYSGQGRPGNTYATFDPSNIRSVNAAFDPDNAASPQLLAGFGKDLLTAGAAGATIGGAMIARDEMLGEPRDNALAVPEPSPAPINPNMPRNAVARTYGAPQAPLDQQDPDDPRNFGVESFEDLRPNDPLRDPWFRREMIKRSLRDQAYQRAQGESRTVGKPKEKRTVGKAGAN
jgi:hypothetical protein